MELEGASSFFDFGVFFGLDTACVEMALSEDDELRGLRAVSSGDPEAEGEAEEFLAGLEEESDGRLGPEEGASRCCDPPEGKETAGGAAGDSEEEVEVDLEM